MPGRESGLCGFRILYFVRGAGKSLSDGEGFSHRKCIRLDVEWLDSRGEQLHGAFLMGFEHIEALFNRRLREQHTQHIVFLKVAPFVGQVNYGNTVKTIRGEQLGFLGKLFPIKTVVDHQYMRHDFIVATGIPVAVERLRSHQQVDRMNVRCDHIASMPHCGGKSLRRFLGEFVIQPRRLGQQPHPVPLADAFFGSQHDDTQAIWGMPGCRLAQHRTRKRLGMFKIPQQLHSFELPHVDNIWHVT